MKSGEATWSDLDARTRTFNQVFMAITPHVGGRQVSGGSRNRKHVFAICFNLLCPVGYVGAR
eukprot:3076235-Prorocentrum_lima.AAC.1